MNIIGRILGTILGYKLLGPLGAILGYFVGAMFDRGISLHLHHIPRQHTVEVQQAFFTAAFSVMGHLAKSDGHVSEDEIQAARNLMNRLELNDTLRQEAIRLFNEGKSPDFNLESTLDTLYQECGSNPDLLRFFIEIELEAALSDGPLEPEEQDILAKMCNRFGISAHEFEQLWARQWASNAFHDWFEDQFSGQPGPNGQPRTGRTRGHYYTGQTQSDYRRQSGYSAHGYGHRQRYAAPDPTAALQEAYGVLGVSPSDEPAVIKKAYKKLMNQHHPDKLVSRGLPESMVKLAQEKTQQITAAYNLICKARGFR